MLKGRKVAVGGTREGEQEKQNEEGNRGEIGESSIPTGKC